jgi:valyl-tRNA synthetase
MCWTVDLIVEHRCWTRKRSQGRKPETALPGASRLKEFWLASTGYGGWALRFTFATTASLGRSINFNKRCEGCLQLCNKLERNRFVLMNCEGDCGLANTPKPNAPGGEPWYEVFAG